MPVATPVNSLLPNELPTVLYANAEGLIAKYNNRLYNLPKTVFKEATWIPDILQYPGLVANIRVWYTGRIDINGTVAGLNLDHDGGHLKIFSPMPNGYHAQLLYDYEATLWYDDFYLYPEGTKSIWAASFNVWSTRQAKSDIEDLTGFTSRLKKLKPKKYKEGPKKRQGFIAEDSPAEYRDNGQDENGKPIAALDLMSILTDVVAEVRQLRQEIDILKKGKGSNK